MGLEFSFYYTRARLRLLHVCASSDNSLRFFCHTNLLFPTVGLLALLDVLASVRRLQVT